MFFAVGNVCVHSTLKWPSCQPQEKTHGHQKGDKDLLQSVRDRLELLIYLHSCLARQGVQLHSNLVLLLTIRNTHVQRGIMCKGSPAFRNARYKELFIYYTSYTEL